MFLVLKYGNKLISVPHIKIHIESFLSIFQEMVLLNPQLMSRHRERMPKTCCEDTCTLLQFERHTNKVWGKSTFTVGALDCKHPQTLRIFLDKKASFWQQMTTSQHTEENSQLDNIGESVEF